MTTNTNSFEQVWAAGITYRQYANDCRANNLPLFTEAEFNQEISQRDNAFAQYKAESHS